MNNKTLPSHFSVKPLALLIPMASLAILSSAASAQLTPSDPVVVGSTYSSVSISAAFNSVTVANTGTIRATSGPALTIDPTANITAITNQGVIEGTFAISPAIVVQSGAMVGSINNGSGARIGGFGGIPNTYTGTTLTTNFFPYPSYTTGSSGSTTTIPAGSSTTMSPTITTFTTTSPLQSGGPSIRMEQSIVGSITNSGTILGSIELDGAQVTGGITNASGGIIERGTNNYGINIESLSTVQSITNNGTIDVGGFPGMTAANAGTGIVVFGSSTVGAITNTGVIDARAPSAPLLAGVGIDISNASVASISNSGLIDVDGLNGPNAGTGIRIGEGASVGSISNSGSITSNSAVPSTISSSVSGGGIIIETLSTVGSLANSGTIEGDIRLKSGAEVTGAVNNSGLIDGEIYIAAGGSMPATSSVGSLINSGTITGGFFVEESEVKGNISNTAGGEIRDGIVFDRSSFGGDLANAGLITSAFDGDGFDAIPATISINGDPSSSGTPVAPLEINLSGQIVNTGSIANTAAAVTLISGPPPGNVKPSAGVSDPAAIYLNYVNMADGIYNDGIISSTAGTAIRLENSNLNIISNTGTMTGGNTYAIFVDDTAEVKQIDNSGVINGIVDFGAKGGLYKSTGGTSGAVVNATSLQIGAATAGAAGPSVSTINGNFTFSGPMTFDANGFDGGIRYGQLDVSGNAAVTGALNINVSGETFFSNDEVLELIKTGGGLTTNIVSAEDNSLLLDFTISTDANSLFATVERENVGIVVETLLQQAADINITDAGAVNTAAIAISIQQISVLIEKGDISKDSALGQTIAQLQGITDPVLLVQAIQSLEPESGGAGSEGSKAAAGAVSAVIANRQASLRNSLYETGMVAGDDISITGFWIQGYDKDTEQEVREGIDGFDVDMYGVALGADAPVGERTTVGMAISYADSQVDSTGIENNQMAIDSYQISSYVSFNEDDYYLDALVSFARNEYEGKRNLFNGLTATADYSGDQYGLRARGGYPFVLESGVHVTPNTSIEYSYLKEEGYSEEGAGNSGLDIGSQSLEALVWAAGVKVAYPFTTESDTTWMPDFHIEVRHDFIADEVELDSNFVGVGGAGFSTNGASVERVAYKAGVGLRAWSQSSVSFMFRYDYTYKKDYNSQAVAATMRYSF